ncbi:MAG: hypothetical protein ACRDNK_06240 [Solirubrobacteraceae bacterium]
MVGGRLRRLSALLTVGLLAAAAPSARGDLGANGAGDFLDLRVAITPPKAGTAKVPQGVGLSLSNFLGNRINADDAIPITSMNFFFRQGFTENGQLFPSCSINPTTISRCSRASQIGTGSAETERLNPGGEAPSFASARVLAYNGAPYLYGGTTLIFIVVRGGRPVTEMDFVVRPQARGLAINQLLLPSAGPGTGITRFTVNIPDRHVRVRVKGKTVTVHLFDAPTTCARAWTFGETTTSSGRPPIRATDSQTCVKG